MSEFVSVHVGDEHPGVGTLLLSRPPTNALTRQLYREVAAAAAEVGRRDDIAAVILFGGHEIFSAGDDVTQLRTLNLDEADGAARLCRAAVAALAAIPKPTVAAVTGYALGAGLTLALAADWRIGGDNAKFASTEILAGLIPGGGSMAMLVRSVGVSKAKDLVFSGRFVDAREALAMGLIDDMVAPDEVYDAAARWAARFTEGPPNALAAAKAVLDRGQRAADPGQTDAERRLYVEVFSAGQSVKDGPFLG